MKYLIIVITALSVWVGCPLCYGEDQNSLALPMFRETQQATVFYLDNGMEVILVENHANPMIAAIAVVKTGSRNEDAADNGSAHFLEHLLFNGTKTRTQKQIYDEMDFYGGYNNAHTGPDYTNYMILMPKEFIAQGMDVQADMLFNSTLPEDKFEKERGIVIEEIGKGADKPEEQAGRHFTRTFYAGTPYERPVLGTVSTISHLRRERVWDYYRTWYAPNNMTLMVIGDFSTPGMAELVKEKYGPYPAGQLPERAAIKLKSPQSLRIGRSNGMGKFPEDRQYLTMGYLLPPPDSDDFQSLEILAEFLGGRKDSVLETLFEQENNKDMVDSIDAGMEFNREFSSLQISATLPVDADVERVVEMVTQAVRGMAKNAVPAGELQSSLIAQATHDIYLQENLHYYGMMKSGYLAAGGYAFLRDYLENLMKVTPQSIMQAAEKHLCAQVPVVTLTSPPAKKAAKAAAGQSPNQYHTETLANGLTVVVKENQDSRVVGLCLLAKERGLCEGKELWGLTEVLQRMLIDGGSVAHPESALYQEIEAMGAEVKVCDDPNVPFDDYYHTPRFAYVRMKLVDVFFERGLKLLAEMATQPNLTEEVFHKMKKQVVLLSSGAGTSAPKVAERLLYDNLFQENPGYGRLLGDGKRLEQATLDDVKTLYRRLYNPANLVVTISGNVSIDKAVSLARQYLGGAWGEAGWRPQEFTPKFQALDRTVREKVGKQQSYVSVANTCEVSEDDLPALYVLEDVFSDRLAFNLREKQGLAYSIGVGFQKYRGARWYRITMGTRPENIDRAIDGIRAEIRAMRESSIPAEEVQKTVNAMLGRRGMRRLDRVNQAYYLTMQVFDGKPPESDEQDAERLKKVTAQAVELLARKVFRDDNHLVVIAE